VTPDASLEEAALVRTATRPLTDPEYERLSKIPVSEMTEDEYEYVKMRARATPGKMVVDFRRLLLEGAPAQNVLLMDGDEIRIPLRKDHVSVLGSVRHPGNVTFESELGYRDYVRLAGGFAERADEGKTRVVRIDSGDWEKPGDVAEFRPGDTIWVPEKRDREWWKLFRDGLLVATQIATLYLVADRAVN
jgi:polysaccharide export outer membrane protein